MLKPTYRGIYYRFLSHFSFEAEVANKTVEIERQIDWNNKLISIRPIHYFTYRGVSYTKNVTFDNTNKRLLDIDRQ